MEQTVNPGTEARAEGAATLTQADLDRVVQQTIARERRRAEAALEAARKINDICGKDVVPI